MEFAFTEEQQMIRASAEEFFSDVSTSEHIRTAMDTELGFQPELWQRICTELYFQAIIIPEELGGMGLGFVELVAVMEQMGRFLVCAPYFSTVCMASTAVLLGGDEHQQAEFFGKVLEGGTATLAFTSSTRFDAASVTATYTESNQQYVLNGQYAFVIDGHSANTLVLAAKSPTEEIALFMVDANAEGIQRTWTPTLDQTRKQAKITLHNVVLNANARLNADAHLLQKVLDIATICLAAEQVGGSQQVLDMTVAYAKERVQFNRPIASFQAVKHKAADMMTKVEASRSGLYYAACIAQEVLVNGPLAEELTEAASIIKSYVSEAYFQNAGDAIQLHGGVGFTWEYDVHLYFKRAKASEHYLGNASYHRERLAQLLLA